MLLKLHSIMCWERGFRLQKLFFFRIVKERLLAGVIESAFYYVSRASIWSTENIFFGLRAKIIGWCCRNCIIGVQMIYLMEIELLRKILEQLSFPSGLWSEEVAGGIKENAIFLMCPEQKSKQKEKFLRIPARSSDSSCKKKCSMCSDNLQVEISFFSKFSALFSFFRDFEHEKTAGINETAINFSRGSYSAKTKKLLLKNSILFLKIQAINYGVVLLKLHSMASGNQLKR